MKNFLNRDNYLIFLCLFFSALLHAAYLLTPLINSDFAIVGLAARHILKGEFPLFFYGVAFEGVIESYLAAPLFLIFGSSRLVLNCVPAFVSLLLILAVYKLAKTIYGNDTAKLTLLFSSIAPPYFLHMTTLPYEGYIETTLLGTIAFVITYKIIYAKKNLPKLYFFLGLIIGFCLYLQFHIVPFAITSGILLFLNDKKICFRKEFIFAFLGFLLGSSPLLIYNITHNFETFNIIGSGREYSSFIGTLKHLFWYGYWLIVGAKAGYAPVNYVPYISSLVLIIYLFSFIYTIIKRRPGSWLVILFIIVFSVTYWYSGKGTVNTRRYLFPLYSVTPIVLAYGIDALRNKSKLFFYSVVIFIIGHNLYTNFISITYFNPEDKNSYQMELLHDKNLYNFLDANRINGIYTLSWWVGPKLNFDFKEEKIFTIIGREPYPKYLKFVESQPNPAILTYYEEFIQTLDSIGGAYKRDVIAPPVMGIIPYTVYYDFKPPNQELEEIDNANWNAYPSHNEKSAPMAFDRDIATRWHSDTAQKKDMSFIIDLGNVYSYVTRLTYLPGPATDWPCGYELYASTDKKEWNCITQNPNFISPTFWNGPHPFIRSKNGFIELDFQPQAMRYLKLVLTGDKSPWYWSITELYIYRQKKLIEEAADWDITRLCEKIQTMKNKKIYADLWATSHLDESSYLSDKTIDNNYIYEYSLVDPKKFTDYIFVVLSENYPAFIKEIKNTKFKTEDFGQYKLITFDENTDSTERLYWDGFHLLKMSYEE